MKKLITLTLCALLALSLAACTPKEPVDDTPQTLPATDETVPEENPVQVPNPFGDFESLADASASAGFEMTAPETYEGVSIVKYRAIAGDMTEIIYYDAADAEIMRVRKASRTEDISGDNTAYADTQDVAVGDRTVNFRGTDGKYVLATWSQDGYSYAVSLTDGMAAADWTALLDQVK